MLDSDAEEPSTELPVWEESETGESTDDEKESQDETERRTAMRDRTVSFFFFMDGVIVSF